MPPPVAPLIVHPLLHESGFGNQFGMALQHLAITQLAGRDLVLPHFRQPREHLAAAADSVAHVDPGELIELRSLTSPCSNVSSIALLRGIALPASDAQLTYAIRREHAPETRMPAAAGRQALPLWELPRLPARHESVELALVHMLRADAATAASVRLRADRPLTPRTVYSQHVHILLIVHSLFSASPP
jgi:hypothetical protein